MGKIKKAECSLGGDEREHYLGCAYSGDYHFHNGECLIRGGKNRKEIESGRSIYTT